MTRRLALTGLLAVVVLTTAGCRFEGLNSLPLPGNHSAANSYRITVEMADIQNLVANSEVKAGDVTIGSVRSVRVEEGIARLGVELDSAVPLPADTTARLAQKSLLGAQYLELAPPEAGAGVGTLRGGDVIGIERASRYPDAEQVLASVSLLLNGGALEQIRTVTQEWGQALDGREEIAVETMDRLHGLISALDEQRGEIQRAIDNVDRLAAVLAQHTETVAAGVDALAPALELVREQQDSLTEMLDAMNRFAGQGREVLDASADSIAADLASLRPVLEQLTGAGSHLAGSLYLLISLPFPVSTFENMARGDYLNLFMTLDLSAETLENDVLGSFPGFEWTAPAPASAPVDPLTAPLTRVFEGPTPDASPLDDPTSPEGDQS